MLTMDILRHGALEGGIKYRGHVDDPLTHEGWQSMERVWANTGNAVDCIITSPLRRCAEPARAWAKTRSIACIVEPRVAEIRYGAWEGKTIPELQAEYPDQIRQWRANPQGMRPPGGESPEELLERLSAWWSEACQHYDGRHLLLITHSGSMRMLLSHVLGAPISSSRHLAMPYACWSRITHHEGNSQLLFHNRQTT